MECGEEERLPQRLVEVEQIVADAERDGGAVEEHVLLERHEPLRPLEGGAAPHAVVGLVDVEDNNV